MCIVALCVLSAYHVQEFKPIGTAHNRRAQPFVAAANIDDKRQVVSSSYNSPIGLYSSGNIQDALHGQLRGLIPNSSQKWVSVFTYNTWSFVVYHYLFCFQFKSPALAVFSENEIIHYPKKRAIKETFFSNTENYPFSFLVATLQVAKICPLHWGATLPSNLPSCNCTLLWMFLNTAVIVTWAPGMNKLNMVTSWLKFANFVSCILTRNEHL